MRMLEPRKKGFDSINACDLMHKGRGAHQISTLNQLHSRLLELQSPIVEGATLVSNEDNALKFVGLYKELKLIHHALLLQCRLLISRQTSWPPRQTDSVIARQIQAIGEKVIRLGANSPIRAVDRRGMDSFRFIGDRRLVRHELPEYLSDYKHGG